MEVGVIIYAKKSIIRLSFLLCTLESHRHKTTKMENLKAFASQEEAWEGVIGSYGLVVGANNIKIFGRVAS